MIAYSLIPYVGGIVANLSVLPPIYAKVAGPTEPPLDWRLLRRGLLLRLRGVPDEERGRAPPPDRPAHRAPLWRAHDDASRCDGHASRYGDGAGPVPGSAGLCASAAGLYAAAGAIPPSVSLMQCSLTAGAHAQQGYAPQQQGYAPQQPVRPARTALNRIGADAQAVRSFSRAMRLSRATRSRATRSRATRPRHRPSSSRPGATAVCWRRLVSTPAQLIEEDL